MQYGKQLWENYRTLQEDLAHEDLDRFGRSVSLACMPQPNINQHGMTQPDSQMKVTLSNQIPQDNNCRSIPEEVMGQTRLIAVDPNVINFFTPFPPYTHSFDGFNKLISNADASSATQLVQRRRL